MKHRVLDDAAVAQMLYDDTLQEGRCHAVIPDALRIYNKDRTAGTDTETRRLTALDAARSKQQSLALQQRRQQTIQLPAATVRRTKTPDAHQDVAAVRVHRWGERGGHRWMISDVRDSRQNPNGPAAGGE
jgi:hypothetical protein